MSPPCFPPLADAVNVTDLIRRYATLGHGWGNSVLALAAVVAGFGGPLGGMDRG